MISSSQLSVERLDYVQRLNDECELSQCDVQQLIDFARRSLAARSWEPIETAPKDREVLLAGQWVLTGNWDIQIGQWLINRFPFVADGPHYWMPLPPPPTSERKDDDAAIRQQIDVDRGSERRGNERLHPGDTGGSDTVAVSTDVRPIAPAPAESGEQIARQKLNEASIAADEAMERMSKLFPSPPDLEGVVERLRAEANALGEDWPDEAASLLLAMKAENEQYKMLAENNKRMADLHWKHGIECEKLLTAARQEAERLRGALEKIQELCDPAIGPNLDPSLSFMIARSALTHQGE